MKKLVHTKNRLFISGNQWLNIFALAIVTLVIVYNSSVYANPTCSDAIVEYEVKWNGGGNGWGYENGESCRYEIPGDGSDGDSNSDADQDSGSGTIDGYPQCSEAIVNYEVKWNGGGSGWGYDNGQSCRYEIPDHNDDGGDDDSFDSSKITDFILTAGQSNATGQNSKWDVTFGGTNLGASQSNVYVWVPNNNTGSSGSWEVADLCSQNWHVGAGATNYPSRTGNPSVYPNIPDCQNHPAFQLAKQLAGNGRTIGIIATGLPGTPISEWGPNKSGRTEIDTVVSAAINNSNADYEDRWVKYIAWAQGEDDLDETEDYYLQRFRNLVTHWRTGSTGWQFASPNTNKSGIVVAQYVRGRNFSCVGRDKDPNARGGINIISAPSGSLNQTNNNNEVNKAFNAALTDSLIEAVVDTTNACTALTNSGGQDPSHYNTLSLYRLGQAHAGVFSENNL